MARSSTADIPPDILPILLEARESIVPLEHLKYVLIGIYRSRSEYRYHWIDVYEYSTLKVNNFGRIILRLINILDYIANHYGRSHREWTREYTELFRGEDYRVDRVRTVLEGKPECG